jgi:non-specific serine/threonine protein kinase/serine/threonine-protein kinase
MTPERWRRLQTLFNAAVELPAAEQAAYLDEACAGDPELRRQAQSLILAYEAPTEQIQDAIRDVAAGVTVTNDVSAIGRLIGPYKVIDELGRGGMGDVYLAVRADDEYQKRVAIKLVQHDFGNPEILRRFRNERQILAGLDHPYVARLLDGATTPDGMPYVVMEYVAGEPIDRYCENHRLSVEERLKLFRKICDAVHYAHQNLIIHRDLKPGNILVTADGAPKLLDFGIAKLLNPELGPQTQAVTRIAMRLMTPEYASPEQIRGEPLSTASDVYSLGVVLYQLLTSHRPYQFKNYESQVIEQVVSFAEPVKPSAIAAHDKNEKLRRQLAGELDAIVMMALRKEPQRRYSSVEQLSEDIRRHLEGRPVRARPDTMTYRAGKFVKRHKVGIGAVALLVLTLIGGVVATAWQARIARAERARAERRFNDVRKLANSFMFEVHDNIADLPGSTRAREALVKSALEYLNSLAQESAGDPTLQRELALAYQRVGDVQGNPTNANLGDTKGALASYQQALSIADALLAANPGDTEAQRSRALTYQKLSDLQAWTGDLESAIESARKSLNSFQALADADSSNAKSRQSLAIGHIKLGDILGNPLFANAGDRAGAVEQYRRSLALWQSLYNTDSTDATTRRYLGLVHERIGTMLQAEGQATEALASFQQSLVIRQSYAADHPTNTDARRDLAVAFEKLSEVMVATGDVNRALDYARKSFDIFAALSTADPNNVNASRSLSISHEHMGDVLLKLGDANGALDQYHKSVSIREALSSAGHGNVQPQRDLAKSYAKLGAVHMALAANGAASRRAEHVRQAQSWYQRSMSLWLELRNRGVLRGDDLRESERIFAALGKSASGTLGIE